MRTITLLLSALVLLALSEGCSIRYKCGVRTVSYRTRCHRWSWWYCTRTRTEAKICTKPCPVDARMSSWSSWKSYSPCTKSCGTGYMKYKRDRSCTPPANGGKPCASTVEYEIRRCNTQHCPVDAVMSEWSSWEPIDECTKSCGTGYVTFKRTRTCEPPKYGGKECDTLSQTDVRECNTQHCPVDAVMSEWSSWEPIDECTKSCGTGHVTIQRTRTCEPPKYGGKECDTLSQTDVRECNTQHCPVDAMMSEWSSWEPIDECTKSCGTGHVTIQRTRTCEPPKYGGKECDTLSQTDVRECNTQHCPVDAVMSEWSSWEPIDECTKSCGTGQMTIQRTRTCEPPKYGGKECDPLSQTDVRECNTQHCPVDGQWSQFSDWSPYTDCTVTCGSGSQTRLRSRTCSAPEPQYGGADCVGEATQEEQRECNTQPCPIHGQWTEWDDWTPVDECPVLCGGGQTNLSRSRSCSNPAPLYGGKECEGVSVEYQNPGPCHTQPCGDLCPKGERRFHPHAEDSRLYYECDDHQVARLATCPDLGTWKQTAERCAPVSCDLRRGLNQPHPDECNKFIFCLMGHRVVERKCPSAHAWNDGTKKCEMASNGKCFF